MWQLLVQKSEMDNTESKNNAAQAALFGNSGALQPTIIWYLN